MIRRRAQGNGEVNRRESMQACMVVITNKIVETGEEEYLECELQGDDLLDGESFRMVNIQGLSADWAEENGIESGISTIYAPGSYIDDDMNALIVDTAAEVEVGRLDTQ